MQTTTDFLDAVKAKHGITSDYKLSKIIGCTHSSISHYRSGKSRLDENTACKVAELLDIEPGFVLACIAAERAKNEKVRNAWMWTAQHLGGLAAVLAIVAALPFLGAVNLDTNQAFFTESSPTLYIMSNNRTASYPL